MAWRRPGDKPLSEPMMVSLSTHICVTRPQWVNGPICHSVGYLISVCSLLKIFEGTSRPGTQNSCVSGAAAELRLKFCVSCGWLGSENDSAATVAATHVSCGRRASGAPNRTQKIPQRRHVQPVSTYWRRAFAVPSTCVRRATGHVSLRRCACLYLSGTAPVHWRRQSHASHPRTYPPCPEYI